MRLISVMLTARLLTAPVAVALIAATAVGPASAHPRDTPRVVSGTQSARAAASAPMVCGGHRLYDVRQGGRIRIRLHLGEDIAVLTAVAGHNRYPFPPARVRHARVVVRLHGFGPQTYRIRPVHQTFGPGVLLSQSISAPHDHSPFCLTHLAGAAHPSAALTTTSGYNQCCLDLEVFAGDRTARSVVHAATAPASLAARHRSAVVRTANPAFTAAFTDYADSNLPLEVYAVVQGRLVNASPRFPRAIRRDARHQWRQFVHPRNGPNDGLGALAAWVADKYVLDHGSSAWARVHRLLRAGRLHGVRGWPRGNRYVEKLRTLLIRTGYASR